MLTPVQEIIVLCIVASELVHRYKGALWPIICDNPLMKVYTMKAAGWQAELIEGLKPGLGCRVSREKSFQDWRVQDMRSEG